MPIHLPQPAHDPRGPDGQGWNRLSIQAITADECALRPRSYATLWESQDTRRARWGGFGACVGDGRCTVCPVLAAPPRALSAVTDRVLVRLRERVAGRGLAVQVVVQPWVMNRPEDGWGGVGVRWSWEDLARVEGWRLGERYRDEHGEGFWLARVPVQHPQT